MFGILELSLSRIDLFGRDYLLSHKEYRSGMACADEMANLALELAIHSL